MLFRSSAILASSLAIWSWIALISTSLHLVQIDTCSTIDVEGLQELSSTILAWRISFLSLRSEIVVLQTSKSLTLAIKFSFSILRLAREMFNYSILASKLSLLSLGLGIETLQTPVALGRDFNVFAFAERFEFFHDILTA